MSYYVNCENCGRQVLVEKLDDICYWCNEPIKTKVKEEVTMSDTREETVEVTMQMRDRALKMSREEKMVIAREAQERGAKVVALEKGLPMEFVRAWIGAYCRKASAKSRRRVVLEPNGSRENYQEMYEKLKMYHDGYRQAVLDIFGQGHVEGALNKE